jgi:hypothetical protein
MAERDAAPSDVLTPAPERPPGESTPRWTPTVESMLAEFHDASVPAGDLVAHLLRTHPGYIDPSVVQVSVSGFAGFGVRRSAEEHLSSIRVCFDDAKVPVLGGRHVVLGLALEPSLGWDLLSYGVVGSLLSRWQPGRGTTAEPHRLLWDVLSDAGREQADEQPLLAAAFGAPAEWTVTTPGHARAIAWSPTADRVACLVGGTVYETGAEQPLRVVGEVGADAVSLGWGDGGVVALTVTDGVATSVRAADGSPLGDWSNVTDGMLSGDGAYAWLSSSDGVYRWAPGGTATRMTSPKLSEPVTPLAADYSGQHALLRLRQNSVLVAALPPGSLPGARVGQDPYWPDDAAPMVGWTHPRRPPCAVLALGGHGVVSAEPDGVHVDLLPRTPVCRIAAGPSEVHAFGIDRSGTRLSVAVGDQIAVWSLAPRVASRAVPRYDSDLAAGADLLDADRDAQAVAALIASKDLRPPLSIGLFGSWGSGKSFVLGRITQVLRMHAKPPGYLKHISVIEFNAWHYAEANLWASLVDQVLEAIAPIASPVSPPEVTEATEKARAAQRAAEEAAQRAKAQRETLERAERALARRRRHASLLLAAVLALLGVAVIAALVGGWGRVVAVATAATALLGSAAGALANARRASADAAELAAAGRAGVTTIGRLVGQPDAIGVQAHGAELRRLQEEHEAARRAAERLEGERDRLTALAAAQPLGALLHRLSTITDYRDQLSLVTRTREHFGQVDDAIRMSATMRAEGGSDEPALERIVVVIDDLDRCPPEKVVTVLEAVHLLFSFEMFVVLIAVDTRWLEQSLRIKYRQLLGRSATATPRDYLEKIIQVPLHLVPLDEDMVRTMITGLTGVPAEPSDATGPPPDGGRRADEPPAAAGPVMPEGRRLVATMPRPRRPAPAAEILHISPPEATAMAGVAPLVGTTPRTVKRFVNTYRLLKARASTSAEVFDADRDGLGDHEAVAFLLALVTGHPQAAATLFPALRDAVAGSTVQEVLARVHPVGDSDDALATSLSAVSSWLLRNPRYAAAPARRLGPWTGEVARFSFTRW